MDAAPELDQNILHLFFSMVNTLKQRKIEVWEQAVELYREKVDKAGDKDLILQYKEVILSKIKGTSYQPRQIAAHIIELLRESYCQTGNPEQIGRAIVVFIASFDLFQESETERINRAAEAIRNAKREK